MIKASKQGMSFGTRLEHFILHEKILKPREVKVQNQKKRQIRIYHLTSKTLCHTSTIETHSISKKLIDEQWALSKDALIVKAELKFLRKGKRRLS